VNHHTQELRVWTRCFSDHGKECRYAAVQCCRCLGLHFSLDLCT